MASEKRPISFATIPRPQKALALTALGRLEEAGAAFDRAVALGCREAVSGRGCLDLMLGRFERGWDGYEARWVDGKSIADALGARYPIWRGPSSPPQRVLVINDHGLGDTIQFFRYVALLAQAGAEVTFAGPPKMRRLLASSRAAVTWREEADVSGDFAATLAISSLPRACGTRLESIPDPIPYLCADADRKERWRDRMTGPELKIGLCWRGNIDFRVDPRRSIPAAALAPLAGLYGVRLVSLQKGAPASELPEALASRVEHFDEDFDAGPDAFLDTAAIMAHLDLIVTCDTSVAHLAGALGRPVWVALRHVSEWRWLDQRADSPWYPTMRLFRCGEGDDWLALFEDIAAEIRRNFGL